MEKRDETLELKVEGMTCSNCALGITRFLENKGMHHVHVNFATGDVVFDFTGNISIPQVVTGIEQLGYKVVDEPLPGEKKRRQWDDLEVKFMVAAFLTVPLLLSMIPWLTFLQNNTLHLILCLPVYLIGAWHFGKSALGSLRSGVPNMDVLIFTGSSAAFFYSLYGYLANAGMHFMFFETAASIITLVLLGNVIEKKSVQQTTTAINDLKKLQPQKAKKIHFDLLAGHDQIEEVAVSSLQKNDVVLVNTGDQVPADGVILSGEALINESMISGESVPVHKIKNDAVTGATMNTDGIFKMRVTASGDQSVLAAIIALVKKAQTDKLVVQRLADKIAAVFVPVVLALSLLTFLLSFYAFHISAGHALLNSIAVLVIACPCAMGLATPTAIMVGLGRAARNGILVKGAITLETFSKADIIVFDKTGTITTGAFEVDDCTIFSGDVDSAGNIIHQLEQHSSHPIARSLVKHFVQISPVPFIAINEVKGLGIQAEDSERHIYKIGAPAFVGRADEDFDLYLTKDGVLLAGVKIRDEIKPEAAEMIHYFNAQGIKTIMLSGDNETKTQRVAEMCGIKTYYSRSTPAEKLHVIGDLRKAHTVAMVGDGINDSPSLEAADVGISMSNATEIAMNSAQIILLNGHLQKLSEAHQLSKATVRTIKQNLFWAFFYNMIAIPVAAVGFLSPIIAAGSMAFSDVFVIGNSILLKTRKIR